MNLGNCDVQLELRNWGGATDALEASRKRGQNTQRASFSFSFLIALSPYTVDYCLSYKLFKMRWHGHGLATQ
ncbi:putative cancer susceptibility gene HEPN1 protein [Camelus dromedarius]|uniref:putative cancer susceptibility gene HEPN1 protein n=1 Tax=Camelus dromedarius TaxID=9838 RepID=UPI00057B8BCA